MLKASAVASYFIEQSSHLDENNDLTNLKLQKILFFAQAEHLKKENTPLFSDEIEAWQYGPVVRSVYDWLKGCGAYPITTFDVELKQSGINQVQLNFLQNVWEKYSKYSAGYLVDRTHEKGSPWFRAYESDKSNVIVNDKIKEARLQEEWA